jgi:hypothetical protein
VSALVSTRLRDLFLAPGADAPAVRVAERAVPATLGVLTAPRDAAVAGACLALAAAAAHRSRCAIVCHWDDAGLPPRASGLAAASARRMADRLARRGLTVSARGRLVTVTLPVAAAEARAATERTLAAAGDAPLVLVLAGARPPGLDPLLATLDRLVVVPTSGAPAGLAPLAVAAAARLGRSTAVLHLPETSSATGRLIAATGHSLSPRLRAAAAAALEGGDA